MTALIKPAITGLLILIILPFRDSNTDVKVALKPDKMVAASELTDWIKARTKELSPDSWNMLMLYDNLPVKLQAQAAGGGTISSGKATDTFYFLEGDDRINMLVSMETNVHETAHGFFSSNVFRYANENSLKLDWQKVNGYIYLNTSQTFFISFPKKSLYPSNELADGIDEDLRTSRFETYITGNSSTQDYGVIGLLDELHAYYLGSRFSFDMLQAYKEADGSADKGFFDWVRYSQSTMCAFYEFDFFIKEYLLHMKSLYPGDYNLIKSYKPFLQAYSTIHKAYGDLVDRYGRTVENEIQRINALGKVTASKRDGDLWIMDKQGYGHSTPVFPEDRATLLKVLESDRYRLIENDFPGIW